MKYAWQITTVILTLVCICCFSAFVDYENKIKTCEEAYASLLQDYRKLEEDNEITRTAYRDVLASEFIKIDEYISWKETLTALHKIPTIKINITDEERQKFWDDYFMCQDIISTTSEEE